MNEVLYKTYFNNTLLDYIIAFSIILIGLLFIKFFKKFILTRVKIWAANTKTNFDDFILESFERFGIPALYFLIIYVGINYLQISPRAAKILDIATTAAITILIIRLVSTIILVLLKTYVKSSTGDEEKVKQLGGLMLIINIVVWVIGIVFLFGNMGYDVTAVITGLGIGGIAVALAAQNILGDLFNYFVIFFDRPFEVGDFVNVDEKKGVIEYIGIKTTRVRSLTGEQLVFSNSDLTNSRIHNYKRMNTRRIAFEIGVTYQTTLQQLKDIPEMLKRAVDAQELATFDRAHFSAYGAFSLNFEIVYYVLDSDYNKYMDVQQAINLSIFEEFENNNIEFAYPTQTLFLERVQK